MTSQQEIRNLIKGKLPLKPLFMPLIFSVAARVEDIPVSVFVSNPTKLVSAAREIQRFLGTQSVVAYFDTKLEAEACGCRVSYEGTLPKVVSHPLEEGGTIEALSQGDILSKGRIPVAIEVIKRLRLLVKDQAIVSSVTGPFTLSSNLWGEGFIEEFNIRFRPFANLLDVAGSIALRLARAFCEAGVNMLLITEEKIPELSAGIFEEKLYGILKPICNVARYYETLPVLMIRGRMDEEWLGYFFHSAPDCFVFGDVTDFDALEDLATKAGKSFAIPVPLYIFGMDKGAVNQELKKLVPKGVQSYTRCALVTTQWEIPYDADLKSLNENVKTLIDVISR